jgi:hypothetical protein
MYARVAKWDGGESDAVRRSAEQIRAEASSGPPEGVPAKGIVMLVDPDNGRTLVISLFETEEDLRKGNATFDTMSPGEDIGTRAAVEAYEVVIDMRV